LKIQIKIFILTIYVSNLMSNKLLAQQLYYPLNHQQNISLLHEINRSDSIIHTGFKPLLQSKIIKYVKGDSLLFYNDELPRDDQLYLYWIQRKLLYENFVDLDTSDFYLAVNPLFNFQSAKNIRNDSTYIVNTRGIEIKGHIGKKVSFYTSFYENQAYYVDYIDKYIREQVVVPGQGTPKPFPGFAGKGFDFSMSTGYISYSPNESFNLQIGTDKLFVGDGYRSLLLSDNSFDYPFFRATILHKHWQYSMVWAALQDYQNTYYAYHWRKHATFNYLSWIPNKNIEIGLFEGIIWHTSDSTYNNHFSINFFNPVILMRGFQYGLNNQNNILYGLTWKWKVNKALQNYAQFLLDDIDLKTLNTKSINNKYGFQIGIKYWDVLAIKNLYLQAEYNYTTPYTYSNTIAHQNYSQQNQPLGDPLGAGFGEFVAIANYRLKWFYISAQFNYAKTNTDSLKTNVGSNIFLSDAVATPTFTNNTTIMHKTLQMGVVINQRYNWQIFGGIDFRSYKDNYTTLNTNYYFIGMRSAINNLYFDF